MTSLALLSPQREYARPRTVPTGLTPTCQYPYRDESGKALYFVHRYEWEQNGERQKTFRYVHFENGRRVPNLNGVRRVLYRLPELRAAIASGADVIYVCEGEKDADAVAATGAVATTNPMGAGKWRDDYSALLYGAKRVVVVADVDGPAKKYVGERHAQAVAASLRRLLPGTSVEVRQPAAGKDVSDHLAAGKALADLAPFVPPPETTIDFAVVDDAELDALPDPEWLIDSVVPTDAIALLYGQRGTYKSFVLLDWLLSVQTGRPWLDRHDVRCGQAVLVAGEGWGGLKKRVRVWKATQSLSGRAGLLLIKGGSLRRDDALDRLIATIRARTEDGPVAIVGLDTLNRLLPGIDENTSEAMGRAIAIADRLRSEFPGTTVVWVHHGGWEDKHERGHSSLGDGSDLVIHAEASLEPMTVELSCDKQKDADEFRLVRLQLVEHEADGLRSLVVTPAELAEGPGKPLSGSEQRALDALPATGDLHPKEWAEASGLKMPTLKWARDRLMSRGLVQGDREQHLYRRSAGDG